MKIVIDIPENIYECVKKPHIPDEIFDEIVDTFLDAAFSNSIPLPKGHGRLIILSENRLKENQINLDFSCQKWISEVGLSNATVTIIEADNAESEEV